MCHTCPYMCSFWLPHALHYETFQDEGWSQPFLSCREEQVSRTPLSKCHPHRKCGSSADAERLRVGEKKENEAWEKRLEKMKKKVVIKVRREKRKEKKHNRILPSHRAFTHSGTYTHPRTSKRRKFRINIIFFFPLSFSARVSIHGRFRRWR